MAPLQRQDISSALYDDGSVRSFADDKDKMPPDDKDKNVPDAFVCPLTLEMMEDPLMSRHGHNYERRAILEWLNRGNMVCPLTKKPLTASGLFPNASLREQILAWRVVRGETLDFSTSRSSDSTSDSIYRFCDDSTERFTGILLLPPSTSTTTAAPTEESAAASSSDANPAQQPKRKRGFFRLLAKPFGSSSG